MEPGAVVISYHPRLLLLITLVVTGLSCLPGPPATCPAHSEMFFVTNTLYDTIGKISPCIARLVQTRTYNPGDNCNIYVDGQVELEFASSLSMQAVSFSYVVRFNRDSIRWLYNGTVFLHPGETQKVGVISNSVEMIGIQYLLIQFTSKPKYY
jgi:hypothetical protein